MLIKTLINKIRSHADTLKKLDEKYREIQYTNLANDLEKNYDNNTIKISDVEYLPYSQHMKNKLIDLINNKKLPIIKINTDHNNTELKNKLVTNMGIGVILARNLIDEGLKNISQLKTNKWMSRLPENVQLFLRLSPEQKIPNVFIKKIEKKLLLLEPSILITGSYRRKKPTSRDIDVLIIDTLADSFIEKLKLNYEIHTYNNGDNKVSTIIKFGKKYYKMDIFKATKDSYIPTLLYTTGSKEFNILMRGIAKRKGYLLNQNGLYHNNKKIPNLTTEKDYFDILKINYLEPHERK
jgi:DNA polymerase/3'-5' exonuclease PolX